MKLLRILLLLLCSFSLASAQNTINVKIQGGAKGDGRTDDWEALQKVVDQVANAGGGTIYFPKGTYVIQDKTLLIWGNNITLLGEDPELVILEKKGRAGWWGELMAVCGKSNGGKFYGAFGKRSYNSFVMHNSAPVPARNIQVKNITFRTDLNSVSSTQANNVGVFNASNVLFDNCRFENSPKCLLGIVNNTLKHKNENIVVNNCIFRNSGGNSVKVISYNQGKAIGNSVKVSNCKFYNVRSVMAARELKGEKVHLWYRAGLGGKAVNLTVDNCFFDATGSVRANVNVEGFTMLNSEVKGSVKLVANTNYKGSKATLKNNKIATQVASKNVKLLDK